MDELNVNYFAPKWWVYVMIWLPKTTDNSTYFAQSLEIRGIESRLYMLYANLAECLYRVIDYLKIYRSINQFTENDQ